MVSSPLRYVLLAAAIAATTNSLAAAADLTKFPVTYDALTYSLEFDVEVINELAGDNAELKTALETFVDNFDKTVAAGSLTFEQFTTNVDTFYAKADAIVPKFSDKAKTEIDTRWKATSFRFLNDLHPATWDLIHYGITTAENKQTDDISIQIEKLDNYMTKTVPTATNEDTEKLNEQLDLFYKSIQLPDFEKQVEEAITDKIMEAEGGKTGSESDSSSPSSGDGESPATSKTPTVTPKPSSTPSTSTTTPATSASADDGSVANEADGSSLDSETTDTPAAATTPTPSRTAVTPAPLATVKSGAATSTTLAVATSVVLSAALSLFV